MAAEIATLFADRLSKLETSAIRELFKLLGKPGIISFAGGFPDANLFDVAGIEAASTHALATNPGAALQYGATEGYEPLRVEIAKLMADKGAQVQPAELLVTTGSQQALDLVGKTLINPGDKVIVEGPTFLATIQCFRLYGADLISAPVDGDGVDVDVLEQLIAVHKPKLVYLIPTFGNPSGATLSLARRQRILDIAVKTGTLIVEDDPYGDLYFDTPPPPSLLALSGEVPGARDWLVHCGSLSKVLSPGLRVGWMVAPPALLAKAVMLALQRRLGGLPLRVWGRDTLLLLGSAVAAGLTAWGLASAIAWPTNLGGRLLECSLASAASLLVYGLIASWARVPEVHQISRQLRGRIPGLS